MYVQPVSAHSTTMCDCSLPPPVSFRFCTSKQWPECPTILHKHPMARVPKMTRVSNKFTQAPNDQGAQQFVHKHPMTRVPR